MTAFGTKMAPSYSIILMAEMEEKLLEFSELKPYVWWRYIDDTFVIWEHGEENLQPTIKFTYEFSKLSVKFLDNNLVKNLFVKPTDAHQFLEASSCHVFHTKRAIPYSQALRLNRICCLLFSTLGVTNFKNGY